MFFQYETPRLLLKVLRADCAPQVLDFYNRDKELFEMYEIDRVPDFYTVKHLQKVLRYESVSYTHLRAHETDSYLVCRLLLEKKKKEKK